MHLPLVSPYPLSCFPVTRNFLSCPMTSTQLPLTDACGELFAVPAETHLLADGTTASSLNPTLDLDQNMVNVQGDVVRAPPTQDDPPTPKPAGANPSSRFTIRVPSSMSYTDTVRRVAEESDTRDPMDDRSDPEHSDSDDSAVQEATAPRWPKKATSGPIKGFSPDKVLENLDPLVRESWRDQALEAVFVHYLNGGYNPNVARNVHVIADDLMSECPPTRP